MKRIAVFTSGGDSPGMNAHIRAVVRTAIEKGLEPVGIIGGYAGMIEGDFVTLDRGKTANIVSRGGTIIKTSRSKEFIQPEGRVKAASKIREAGIDGIVACGGDGTFTGAHLLWLEHNIPIVGTPGTIDNDLYGTDFTIGFDTAQNTAAEAIDKIRDTADSHGRVFIIEVMGRHAGFIPMNVGVACGAEFIAVPETVTNMETLYQKIIKQGKNQRTIIIVGEGDDMGGAAVFASLLKDKYNIDSKVTILGHIQRGGCPTVKDRVLASRLGMAAVYALMEGRSDVMVGEIHNDIIYTPLEDTWTKKKPIADYLFELDDLLS